MWLPIENGKQDSNPLKHRLSYHSLVFCRTMILLTMLVFIMAFTCFFAIEHYRAISDK
jgi:hypothetical protein